MVEVVSSIANARRTSSEHRFQLEGGRLAIARFAPGYAARLQHFVDM